MSRRPKKRNKKYAGEDAKQLQPHATEPVVHRYTAVERSKFGQWWFEKKKIIRIIAIVAGIAILAIWVIAELISLIF